ncbi:MAG TPA: glucose-6-phosphate dehydrogenase, partial [Acidimicrobiales bacterium]|nr:glucose-6-phosphate dehydrogenase [Acidimicrobiales bacterium]
MADSTAATADVLVIFGITGDLAKKMTFRSLYRLEARNMIPCPIIGVARQPWSDDDLRQHAREDIEASGQAIDEDVFRRFAARLSMVSGDYNDPDTYTKVGQAIEGRHLPVFYLEIPPSLFARAVEGLSAAGLTKNARV